MNFRILKKDLKRKKSMNLILLLFVMLATTFIAASLNNVKVVMNGVDYYFEQAGISDFIIISLGGESGETNLNDEKIESFLKEQKNVTKYNTDDSLIISQSQIKKVGNKELGTGGTIVVSGFDIRQQKFFDEENQEITDIKEGTIYLPKKALEGSDMTIGDSFLVETENGYKKEFEIVGFVKDALCSPDMMGLNRFVISNEDFEEMQETADFTVCRFYSVYCDDLESFEKEYNNCDFSVIVGKNGKTFRMLYVMDMVIAAVLLMVSICLILIAVIMLRFTIIFTVNEDYKEIGIMKAIGIPDFKIRSLYMSKYFLIAVAGAVIGFATSIPFSRLLVSQVTQSIVVENSQSGFLLEFITSIFVVFVVVFFAYTGTGKIKKFTPMDAVRSGNNGERFGKKTILKLGKSKMQATTFMAFNDVLSELKKYMVLLITSVIGVWLVVMPINTINTLSSEKIIDWFALAPFDFYITEGGIIEELVLKGEKQGYVDYLSDLKERLEEENIAVENVATEVMFQFKARKGEYAYNSVSMQGIGTTMDQYMYEKGEVPAYENEIAITHIIAEKLHADVGDTIYIAMEDGEKPYVVTAIFQSMNNMGEAIRFHEDAEIDYSAVSGATTVQVVLKEKPTEEELNRIIKKVEKAIPEAKVGTLKEYMDSALGGIVDKLEPIKVLILTIVIIINVLVVVLMQKMFLIREQGEMGMMKAIGFSNGAIIGWQTKRIMLVLLLGIFIGSVTGTSFSQITAGQVFKIMGASKITFQINPLEVYVIYPVILFVATVLACMITMLKVRKISPQNMNEVE